MLGLSFINSRNERVVSYAVLYAEVWSVVVT